MKKSILCMILVLLMILTALPMTVFAADADITDTGDDITVSIKVNSDKTVTATWNKVTGISYYALWFLAYDPNYYAVAKGEFVQLGSNRAVNNAEPCTYTFGTNYTLAYAYGSSDYRIRVRAYDNSSNMIAVGTSSIFHTYIPMLDSPTITLAADGTATWTAVANAKNYNIALYDEEEMYAGGSSSCTQLSYAFSGSMIKGKSYYAEVFACNREGGYRDSAPAKSAVINNDSVEISSVAVSGITEPVAGAAPDVSCTLPANCGYRAAQLNYGAVTWYTDDGDIMNPNTDSFKEGEKYSAQVTLIANDGYEFAESGLTGTMNGKDATKSIFIVRPKIRINISRWFTCSSEPPYTGSYYSVIGKVESFLNDTDPVTVTIKKRSTGATVASQTVTGNPAGYHIDNIPSGEYTVFASKKNHATRPINIEVRQNGWDVRFTLYPMGDVNNDGKVSPLDVATANNYLKGKRELEDYALACADVIGTDGKVTPLDISQINLHIKDKKSLWK